MQEELKTELDKFLAEQYNQYSREDLLKIDLHCHDCNSDQPDELLGRILNVPETWIPTKSVLDELTRNGCEALTITNHNNARSIWQTREKGTDILAAAEFSCWVPVYNLGIHVLTYGFTKEQEIELNNLRSNIFHFLQYAKENNIPTIWAHPLYLYGTKNMPPMSFFETMLLVFERFEMLNGQRDTWQNMLVKEWIGSVTPQKIDTLAAKYNIDPNQYCKDIYRKSLSGGSDCHSGFFSGLTGTYLYIPDLQNRLKTEKKSDLVLEAIRKGDMFPYGSHQNTEKITITILNYVCQIALNFKDPGLLRMILHKGDANIKLLSLLVSNAFAEVQRHKIIMSCIKIYHNCMHGKVPSFIYKFLVSSAYKPVIFDVTSIALWYKKDKGLKPVEYYKAICSINNYLNKLLFKRFATKLSKAKWTKQKKNLKLENIISKLELPSYIRAYSKSPLQKGVKKSSNGSDFRNFLVGLTFPFLSSALLLSAHFISAKVMYHSRALLKEFSQTIGKFRHPERTLWLTDTFEDNNVVATLLKEIHKKIKEQNLPIDILVCSSILQPDDHLVVVKPLYEFNLHLYRDLPIRVPNFVELHNLFHDKEYDRIICSTEGIMGAMGLYLKHAYSVSASFFIHNDWVRFSEKNLNFDTHNRNRVRRFFRMYYNAFDKLLVTNEELHKWLTSNEMNLPVEKVYQTTNWANDIL